MKKTKKIAMVSDFDGTISKVDFFYHTIEKLLQKKSDLEPWLEYKAGKRTHVDALSGIFSKIRLSLNDFVEFVYSLPIEESFTDTLNYCNANGIDFYVISAGADYYIKLIFDKLAVSDKLTLYSNNSTYSEKNGLEIIPDKNNPFYDHDFGISKKLAVESLKKNYDFIVYAGDGIPDFEPAKISDTVFARDALLQLCQDNNINHIEFNSYCEILEYFKNL